MFICHKAMNKTDNNIIEKCTSFITDIIYVWWVELKNIFKDEGALIFMVVVPLAYPLLYSWIYNNEVVRDVPVAIVDMSHSSKSREFIQKLDATPDVKTTYFCNNIQEAKDLVGKQVVHGVIYFPEDFERAIGRGEQSHIGCYCDMSLMLTYKAIYQATQSVSLDMNTEIQKPKSFSFTSRDEEINTKPLEFDEVNIFNTTGGYGNALLPGVLVLILQQTLLLGIGLLAGTAREKNPGNHLVPNSPHYSSAIPIITGKGLSYLMVYAVMAAYICLCVPRFFHFTTLINKWDLLTIMVPYLLAAVFFGLMLSCTIRYRENVMLLVVFTSVPFLFLAGVSWPLSNIPGIWQGISWLIPSTFGIRAFLKLSSMGADMSDIQTEYLALWLQTGIYFIASCLVYHHHIQRTKQPCEDEQ